ncbi:MAG: ORF6N domain-containing protein, partial [Elusimicrobia bacterium]|nr:ORF6N domain-containing protein [Elusimicrobiota bacterium]
MRDNQPKVLNHAVKRKAKRFPEDFIFRLTKTEFLRCQFVTSKKGGRRYLPYAFTQNGISMLSSVLNSERAVNVNIQIMRTFTHLMEIISAHKDLAARLEALEKKYDRQFKIVFDAIREIMAPPVKPQKRIGFTAKE